MYKNGKCISIGPLVYEIFKRYYNDYGYVMKYRLAKLIREDISEEAYNELVQEFLKNDGE